MALAATRAPSDLPVMAIVSIQWALGHAAWVCFCQLASQGFKRTFQRLAENGAVLSCLCAFACLQVMY